LDIRTVRPYIVDVQRNRPTRSINYPGVSVTVDETKLNLKELPASGEASSDRASKVADGEDFSPQRSRLDWNEMMLDYTAIERRAQEMRSEAAWAIAGSLRDWAMNLFRLGKAKAQAAAQVPLQSRIQSS
jgi:hypothetical protein